MDDGSRDPASVAGPSNPKEFRKQEEKWRQEHEELVQRTATAKVKPQPERPLRDLTGSVAAKSAPGKRKEESNKHLYPELAYPPRRWGYWSGTDKSNHPWALILFSGRARPGDIHQNLVRRGWTVCSIDTLSPKPTDILDDSIWDEINMDLVAGKFKALWIATPCGTFSPLREKAPGPRVLRTVKRIQGIKKSELSKSEQKQLRES